MASKFIKCIYPNVFSFWETKSPNPGFASECRGNVCSPEQTPTLSHLITPNSGQNIENTARYTVNGIRASRRKSGL